MKKINIYLLITIFTLVFGFQEYSFGSYKGDLKSKKPSLSKTAADPAQSVISINNITTWVGNDGFHDWVVASSWNGAFPNGSNVGAIFAEGIVWGGKVNDGASPTVRVNGNTYQSGCKAITRLFRVRPDYKTGDLSKDAAAFFAKSLGSVTDADIQQLRNQYEKDWNEWPANEGALYKDVDGDGQYNPDVDIPGVPGAAQTIFIKYDDSRSSSNYGSTPIGLEVSETYWAYAYSGALGNVIYKKVDMVYKGTPTSAANSTIDSMYIVQWADPDVGTSGDDFAGCDTSLNLGYAYSSGATDNTYDAVGLAPPAVGYDFLQGVSQYTGNPADSAIFNLKWRKGYKYVNPKPMSSYVYFAAGGTWSDPSFDYNGTLEFYNLMRGKKPIPRYPSGDPFPESVATVTPFGTYLTDGDPVAGTGKNDGAVDGPSDRRIMVTNGPITMSLGDTAQVVVALVGAIGTDNLSSVAKLKTNDNTAQIVFDQLFKLPSIAPPDVKVSPMHNEIILTWDNNREKVNEIESFNDQGYKFEGYMVYQLPNASSTIKDGKLLAVYDESNGITAVYDTTADINGKDIPQLVVQGKDQGVKRFITISSDEIRKKDLVDGQAYYFAVVSYAVNPSPLLPFHVLKSAQVILSVTPEKPKPGIRYGSVQGDTLLAVHDGGSDGTALGIVVDPSATTGDTYEISFIDTTTPTTWQVFDKTKGEVVAKGIVNQAGGDDYPIVDGIMFKVFGPPNGFKSFQVTANANGPLDPPEGGALDFDGFPSLRPSDRQQVGAGHWAIHTGDNGSRGSYDAFLARSLRGDDFSRVVPYDFEMRFTAKGSYAVRAFQDGAVVKVPFELWNTGIGTPDDPSDDYQLIPWLFDTDDNFAFNLNDSSDHSGSGAANDPFTDWVYWRRPQNTTPGTAGYDEYVAGLDLVADTSTTYDYNSPELIARMVLINWNGGTAAPYNQALPEEGTVFRIITTKPNAAVDKFTLQAPGVTNDGNLAKADVEKINVFPNPYYGTHSRETTRSQHYVTFNHLPEKATIRIFDLSGVLVKTIKHEATSGQFDKWNLLNEEGYPVASGVYVIHVDMPDLGKTKILKLALVQETQILKVY